MQKYNRENLVYLLCSEKFHTAKIYNEQRLNSVVFPVFGTCKSTLLNDSDDRHFVSQTCFHFKEDECATHNVAGYCI